MLPRLQKSTFEHFLISSKNIFLLKADVSVTSVIIWSALHARYVFTKIKLDVIFRRDDSPPIWKTFMINHMRTIRK